MTGTVLLEVADACARVTLTHPGKFNAMSRAMWRALKLVFEDMQRDTRVRCVVIQGEGGHFCSGGDIAEYPAFRFTEAELRDFHEYDVWGGLQAMLACDVPIVAQIEGNCMGAGVEIASCCDIRIADQSARFGAPIAKLGFPMAPREAALVTREAGALTVREMLMEAAVFSAAQMQERGFLSRVVVAEKVAVEVNATVSRIVALAPQAARLNKRMLRAVQDKGGMTEAGTELLARAYAYADSQEHREGIAAFLGKRKPDF